MSVIKEGFVCSDEELFEKCRFDLLVRNAMGLFSLSDVVPSIDTSLGLLIYQVLKCLAETTTGYDLLHRVFHEQYEVVKGQAILRPKEDIAAKSVQNLNDPNADYRKKEDQKVKGYSVNITETCNDTDEEKDKPNLIVNVQVKGASAADNDCLKEAVTNIPENVSNDTIEKVYADGAYQSPGSREFADENSIELITSGLQR